MNDMMYKMYRMGLREERPDERGNDKVGARNCYGSGVWAETAVTDRRLVCSEPGEGNPRAMRAEGVYVPSRIR